MKIQTAVPSIIVAALLGAAITQPAIIAATTSASPAATKAATPAFSPTPGTYGWDQSVKITSSTSGATIYYTTNGSTPTTSSTKYKSPIVVSKTQTIRAVAVASGHTASAVAKGVYTIVNSLDVIVATASGNGIVTAPVGGTGAFAVFVKNIGKQSDPNITVSTSNAPTTLPVTVTLCETNPNTGQCLHPPARTVSLATLPARADKTFSVFVDAHSAIPLNTSKNRITVLFKNTLGIVEDSGSVAVTAK